MGIIIIVSLCVKIFIIFWKIRGTNLAVWFVQYLYPESTDIIVQRSLVCIFWRANVCFVGLGKNSESCQGIHALH